MPSQWQHQTSENKGEFEIQCHWIAPATGAPPNFTTLSVIHDSAAMADGLSAGLVFATDQLLQLCIDAPMGPKSIIGRRTSGEIIRFG